MAFEKHNGLYLPVVTLRCIPAPELLCTSKCATPIPTCFYLKTLVIPNGRAIRSTSSCSIQEWDHTVRRLRCLVLSVPEIRCLKSWVLSGFPDNHSQTCSCLYPHHPPSFPFRSMVIFNCSHGYPILKPLSANRQDITCCNLLVLAPSCLSFLSWYRGVSSPVRNSFHFSWVLWVRNHVWVLTEWRKSHPGTVEIFRGMACPTRCKLGRTQQLHCSRHHTPPPSHSMLWDGLSS